MTRRRDLILYATPTGPLQAACDRYFAQADALGPTVAQTYPPHCSLTGFFRRQPSRVAGVATETSDVLAELGQPPPGSVQIVGLHETEDWVGLELSSPWLIACTAAFVARHQLGAGDDEVRPKGWLHLSLAYGTETHLRDHAELARHAFTPTPTGGWEVALWERWAQRWIRHTP